MKRFRSTLLLLATVLAVGGWWWRDQAQPDTSNPLRFDAANVRAIRVQSGPRALVLLRGASEKWTVRSTQGKKIIVPQAPAAASAANELLQAWASANPSEVKPDQPTRLNDFGLGSSAPTLVIDSSADSKSSLVISLGSRVRINPRLFYARVQNSSNTTIALLPQSLLAPLDRPLLEWRDRQLLSFDFDKVTQIEVTTEGAGTTILRRGMGDTTPSSTWSWKRAGAGDFPADPAAVQAATNLLQGLSAQRFMPLDSIKTVSRHAISIRIRSANEPPITSRIEIDSAAVSKTARATSSRLPDVALVDAEGARGLVALWRRPAREWRKKALFGFGVDDASEIFVRAPIQLQPTRKSTREQKWIKVAARAWRREPPISQSEEEATRSRNAITDLLQNMSALKARDFRDAGAVRDIKRWTRLLEMRVRTKEGEQVLEVGREAGTRDLLARITSTARDDDAQTIFVLEDEALEPFQIGLRMLLR